MVPTRVASPAAAPGIGRLDLTAVSDRQPFRSWQGTGVPAAWCHGRFFCLLLLPAPQPSRCASQKGKRLQTRQASLGLLCFSPAEAQATPAFPPADMCRLPAEKINNQAVLTRM